MFWALVWIIIFINIVTFIHSKRPLEWEVESHIYSGPFGNGHLGKKNLLLPIVF